MAHGHLLPGPASPEAFASWPGLVVEALLRQRAGEQEGVPFARVARACRLLSQGLVVHTDFSGQLSPEVCWGILIRSLQRAELGVCAARAPAGVRFDPRGRN